jgi:glycerophosphoryl diester phosphodiesterase
VEQLALPLAGPSLRETQDYWYRVLEESGFADAECGHRDACLRTTATVPDRLTWEARQEYYRQAEQYARTGRFSSRLESLVWRLHAQGLSVRQITVHASLSRVISPLNVYLKHVQDIVARHRELMRRRRHAR